MDVRFHCTKRVRKSGKKSKHGILETCGDICKVLQLNWHYGVPIPGFHDLRKMRIMAPGLRTGKSGGYRLIYSAKEMDQAIYVVFLETYFKGDAKDLPQEAYVILDREATEVFLQPILFDWEE